MYFIIFILLLRRVKYVKSWRGENLGLAKFEGVYLPLLWDSSFCYRSPLALGYTRGHFCALVPPEPVSPCGGAGGGAEPPSSDSQNSGKSAFLPLMTKDRSVPTSCCSWGSSGNVVKKQFQSQWLFVASNIFTELLSFCFLLQFSTVIPRQETAASPLPDQVRGGPGGGDDEGVAGGSRHGVRPRGGPANYSEAATDGGSDDRRMVELLSQDCPVKHCTRWDFVPVLSFRPQEVSNSLEAPTGRII